MSYTLENNDYPALYQIADESSLQGQHKYLKLFRLQLFVLIFGAAVSLFPLDNPNYGYILAIISALMFGFAMAITVGIKYMNLENNWYIGRAIAESLKTLTWRYIMQGEPFVSENLKEDTDKKFCEILSQILSENGTYLDLTAKERETDLQITEKMELIRSLDFEQRKTIYIDFRIRDQLDWYQKKAKFNKKKANTYFYLLLLTQAIAMIYSLCLIQNPSLFNAVPLITAVASGIISWVQVKQFEEFAEAYSVAAQEITLILTQVKYINTENKFSVFIADTENAFSREHTLWLARKDVYNYNQK
jgi:hypothetical protein